MQNGYALISYAFFLIRLIFAKPHLTCLSEAWGKQGEIAYKDICVVTATGLLAFGIYCETEIKGFHNGNKLTQVVFSSLGHMMNMTPFLWCLMISIPSLPNIKYSPWLAFVMVTI